MPSALLGPLRSRHLPEFGFFQVPSACGCHTWPGTPAQSHNCTLVPFAVPELETSRHRPEAGFLRLPLGCHCHTWFAAPVQLHSCTFVPFVVPVFLYALVNSTWVTLRQGGIRWRDTFYPLDALRSGTVR